MYRVFLLLFWFQLTVGTEDECMAMQIRQGSSKREQGVTLGLIGLETRDFRGGSMQVEKGVGGENEFDKGKVGSKMLSELTEFVRDAVLEEMMAQDLPASTYTGTKSGVTSVKEMKASELKLEEVFDEMNTKYLDHVVSTTITHKDATKPDTEFELVVGKGGQVVSLNTNAGQIIPPQFHLHAPWVDEVFQMVGYSNKHDPATPPSYTNDTESFGESNSAEEWMEKDGEVYHQAGSYMVSTALSDDVPFYSPEVAAFKGAEEFTTVNWMQPAAYYKKSNSTSKFLTYTRYKDLSDGVIEVTNLLYNPKESGKTIGALSMPYGGVRTSIMQDTYYGGKFHTMPSCALWMPGQEFDLPNCEGTALKDIDGFMAFVQGGMEDGSEFKPTGVSWTIKSDDPCEDMSNTPGISNWNAAVFRCHLVDTDSTKWGKGFHRRLNMCNGNNDCFVIKGILHPSWKGEYIYFFPYDTPIQDFNKLFKKDDILSLTPLPPEGKKSGDGALSLGIVFGDDEMTERKSDTKFVVADAHTGMRRDFTPFSLDVDISVKPGDALYWRIFFVVGNLGQVKAKAAVLKDHAKNAYLKGGKSTDNAANLLFSQLTKHQGSNTKVEIKALDMILEGEDTAAQLLFYTNNVDVIKAVSKADSATMNADSTFMPVCETATVNGVRTEGSLPLFHVNCPKEEVLTTNIYDQFAMTQDKVWLVTRCKGEAGNDQAVPTVTLVGFTNQKCEFSLTH